MARTRRSRPRAATPGTRPGLPIFASTRSWTCRTGPRRANFERASSRATSGLRGGSARPPCGPTTTPIRPRPTARSRSSCWSPRRNRRPMDVTVKLFAGLRERAGAGEIGVTLPDGARVADALARLEGLTDGVPVVMAVNQEFADEAMGLHAGDELALIPPV